MAFQAEPRKVEYLHPPCPPEKQPQFLVATSRTVSTGLTLTRANHLIKLDVDYLDGHDRQCLKPIYRYGQKSKCFVSRFLTKDNYEEVMVKRRQEFRSGIVAQSYDLPGSAYDVNYDESKIGEDGDIVMTGSAEWI